MRISVIGCGYLGAVHAASMAKLGHDVIGVDVDTQKIDRLRGGHSPFFEPGLSEILATEVGVGRLKFTSQVKDVRGSDVHFIAVGTPQERNGHAADLGYVEAAIESILPHLRVGDLVVGKSTVPVGTAARFMDRVKRAGANLVWNPEFLREGFAVQDTIAPDRLIYGIEEGPERVRAAEILDSVYSAALEVGTPRMVTDLATAELVKVAANAFLATKISFINAMAEISEIAGADVTQLAEAIGMDERIGPKFLGAGIGFGGGCLPKDIRAFSARAEELGRSESVAFLREVDAINLRRRERAAQLVVEALDGSVSRRKIAILGASFKPHSDDIRDSPALDVAVRLHGLGADVVVTDPKALDNARQVHPQLSYSDSVEEALKGADSVLLVTEWDEYRRDLDPIWAASLVEQAIIVDGRNCLDAEAWRAAGWKYLGMGKR